jgi:hypothetical protein
MSEMRGRQRMGQWAILSPNAGDTHNSWMVLVERRKKGLEVEIRGKGRILSNAAGTQTLAPWLGTAGAFNVGLKLLIPSSKWT